MNGAFDLKSHSLPNREVGLPEGTTISFVFCHQYSVLEDLPHPESFGWSKVMRSARYPVRCPKVVKPEVFSSIKRGHLNG